jgi:integration host factor subunit beta
MTKSQLIARLANKVGLPNKEATTVVETVFNGIAESLARGQRVELRGFGSFGLKQREGRVGRNPKTGEAVKVEPKQVMFFKAGKELRERVSGE